MENKEIIEEEEKEFIKFEHKVKYLKKLIRQIIYDIQQNQPEEFLAIDVYSFVRYLVQHSPIQIKYFFKEILPYAEQYYNDIKNIDAFNHIITWMKQYTVKLVNNRFFVMTVIKEEEKSYVESKFLEQKVNDLMRIVINYIHEHKTVSYTQLLRYLYSNKYFIPEDVLIKELQKLESQRVISIQYSIQEGNIPFLIELIEK